MAYYKRTENVNSALIESRMKSIFNLNAPYLEYLRQRYLAPLISQIRGFEFVPRDLKIKTMLSEMEYGTCKFISDGSELRSFLMRKPKNLG